jgi:hypothetical protein
MSKNEQTTGTPSPTAGTTGPAKRTGTEYTPASERHAAPFEKPTGKDVVTGNDPCGDVDPSAEISELIDSQPEVSDLPEDVLGAPIRAATIGTLQNKATDVQVTPGQSCDA